jgi:hypothetical protein
LSLSSLSFLLFAKSWKFQHGTSSSHYAQSNGQAERTVQTIKNMLKKTRIDGTEFRLALLEYLNTPISSKLASPSELLNNRKLRSIVYNDGGKQAYGPPDGKRTPQPIDACNPKGVTWALPTLDMFEDSPC